MVDYQDSSHLNKWLFESPEQLQECRDRANKEARVWLEQQDSASNNGDNNGDAPRAPALALFFACGYNVHKKTSECGMSIDYTSQGPLQTAKGHEFLTPAEESTLVSFYASKLATLIGPKASIPRLRRESKVTATAALLYRRFFCSNSVMMFDPKAILVASAFLASKVEDAMADVRYLQEGTERMQAPVPLQEIISAELALLQGCHYDLLVFHPFKSVLALTEDLRTFLKSEKGQNLAQRPISGQDLKPIYDKARLILEQVIICSDLTLLYSPGPIGLASLIVAQEEILEKVTPSDPAQQPPPLIDFRGYVQQRFPDRSEEQDALLRNIPILCERLRELPTSISDNLAELKKVHKKLKKVRYWGEKESKKKKKKKDTTDESRATTPVVSSSGEVDPEDAASMPPPPKKIKMEVEEI